MNNKNVNRNLRNVNQNNQGQPPRNINPNVSGQNLRNARPNMVKPSQGPVIYNGEGGTIIINNPKANETIPLTKYPNRWQQQNPYITREEQIRRMQRAREYNNPSSNQNVRRIPQNLNNYYSPTTQQLTSISQKTIDQTPTTQQLTNVSPKISNFPATAEQVATSQSGYTIQQLPSSQIAQTSSASKTKTKEIKVKNESKNDRFLFWFFISIIILSTIAGIVLLSLFGVGIFPPK